MTVMSRPASEVTDHDRTRRGVRVIQAGHPDARASMALDTDIARIDEVISHSDIVKLSDGDLAWLRPGDRHGDAIRWLMSRGPAILIVTHRDHAVTGYIRSGSVHVRGHRVEVAGTAEREDAFVAGLVHALASRDLLARRTDRSLRTIGLDDLRGILHDAYVCAARAVTSAVVWPPRTAAHAAVGSLTKMG